MKSTEKKLTPQGLKRRAHYLKNRERLLAKQKLYFLENWDRIQEQRRKKNPPKRRKKKTIVKVAPIIKNDKPSTEQRKQERKEYQAKYYQDHKEQCREYQRKYALVNRKRKYKANKDVAPREVIKKTFTASDIMASPMGKTDKIIDQITARRRLFTM